MEFGGHVTEEMNKDIGRTSLKIAGSVSANNYVEFSNLSLSGPFLYVQMMLLKANVATLHIEISTLDDKDMRITVSSLYDFPRYLGASIRLPLPKCFSWMILALDINGILENFCSPSSRQTPLIMKSIKVLICHIFHMHY